MDLKDRLRVTIIGGGGYIGYHIGVKLFERGHTVTLLDISEPDSLWLDITNITEVARDIGDASWSEGEIHFKLKTPRSSVQSEGVLKFVRGSLLDKDALESVIRGVDCIVHCASYGMSGREQMPSQWTLTEDVNISGVENVLKLSHQLGVRGFVYTSSFNVIYGGQKIVNGDESLPYFPLHKHEDHYSRTKSVAEKLVLFSDNLSHSKNSSVSTPLRTCALRLAGVMGLGEKRHLPRIVGYFKFMFFKYGYEDNTLQQFVTLRNVVQAHVKAAESLIKHPDVLGGQAYFISDGVPINSFQFLRPLRQALGYQQPTIHMPMWFLWGIVYLIQATHGIMFKIHPSLDFPPMLTPAEVYKTAQTHFFSSEKAKRDFGYVPEKPNDISDVIQYYCEKQKTEKTQWVIHKYLIIMFVVILFWFLAK